MIRRTTWLLLIILVIVIAVGWYISQPKSLAANQPTTPAPAKLISGVASETISSIQFNDKNGLVVLLEKQNGSWKVRQPAAYNLTQGNIEEIVTQILDLTILADLSSPPAQESLGLTAPLFTLTISAGNNYVVLTGAATPTDSGYYVQVNQDKPVIVAKTGLDRINELFSSGQPTPTPTTPITTPLTTPETPTP